MEKTTFDAATAKVFNRRPGGSRQTAYQDATGAICLWCRSDMAGGGVAVNVSAIKWLATMPEPHFIRLTNTRGTMDKILPVGDVPLDHQNEGRYGGYYVVDPDDLEVHEFTPVGSDVPF